MNLNKFTEKAQQAILGAQQLAESLNHAQVEPEHLLVTLVEQQDGVVPALLRKMNVDPADMSRASRADLSKGSQAFGGATPSVSPRLKLVIDLAQAEATRLKDDFVSTEHLFVAIAAEAGRSPGARCWPIAASRAIEFSKR